MLASQTATKVSGSRQDVKSPRLAILPNQPHDACDGGASPGAINRPRGM